MILSYSKISELPPSSFDELLTINETANIVKAIWKFCVEEKNALCVINKHKELKGIISWNDFNIWFATNTKPKTEKDIETYVKSKYPETKVEEIMVKKLIKLSYSKDSLSELLSYFTLPHFVSGGYRNKSNIPHNISQVIITDYPNKGYYSIDYQAILKLIEGANTDKVKDLIGDTYFPLEIENTATVKQAKLELDQQQTRQLLVIDKTNNKPIGVVSDTAILASSPETEVRNITDGLVDTLYEDDPVSKAIEIFTRPDRKFRIYPVLNQKGDLINILTYQDILREVLIAE